MNIRHVLCDPYLVSFPFYTTPICLFLKIHRKNLNRTKHLCYWEISSNATLHAVIASVSPLRSTRYFNGEITDGDSVVRIVGFDKAQRQLLHTYFEFLFSIMENKFNGKVEVRNAKIQPSSVEFEISDMKMLVVHSFPA